jgi:hypothetical protein
MNADHLNEPAFPIRGGLHDHQFAGLSMRDYFAAKALPACVAVCNQDTREPNETHAQMMARRAYELADAMLAARSV